MQKLSVIIPGYNTRRDWWIRCVRSVSAAVVKACGEAGEILCVDDGSKEPVLDEWFEGIPGVKVIRLAKNSGLPTARNAGLDAAKGEYVTFVDSDDELREDTFVKVLEAMERTGADVGVYGINSIYANDGYQVHDVPEDKYYGALRPEDVGYLVKRRLFYYSCNKVFRKAFFDQHGLRFNPGGVPCEDAIFNVGLVMHAAKWVTVAYEGYKYYRYDGSLLSSYKPTYEAGTRACTEAWRSYKASAPGVREGLDKFGLGWYDETSDENIVRGQWINIWRRRSPYTMLQRWRFAAEHRAELGRCTPWVFLKKAVLMWARGHLYLKPIRCWHSKRFLKRIGAKVEHLKHMPRFVSVMNIPAPYRIPLFEEVGLQLNARGIDYHVDFMSRGHKDRPKSWLNPTMTVSHRYWKNLGPDQHELNPLLALKYIINPPEYLDLGSPYDTFTCILLALFCRAKVKIMALEGNTKTPGKLDGFIGWFKRLILSRATYIPVSGSDGRRFVGLHQQRTQKKLGDTPYLPNVIDQNRFRSRECWRDSEIAEARQRMAGDPAQRICLIPARFDPVKGLVPFFETVDKDMLAGWHLVIMGHGPQQAEVEELIARRGLTDMVTIIQSVSYDLMPIHYAAADLFLLPSIQDMNPLTVVEALFSGLPIALSNMAGNVEEGVTEGKNGWVLPVMDKAAYGVKLREVFATSTERLREMGRWSVEHNARFWDLKTAVRNYLDAICGTGYDVGVKDEVVK